HLEQQVQDDEASPLVSVLRLSGITRSSAGLLHTRNRIYAQVFNCKWIRSNMPDAEVQRQKAAYMRGVMRTAALFLTLGAIAGGVAFMVAGSEGRVHRALDTAVVAQRNERLQTEKTERLLYAADMELAQRAWEENNVARVVELLETHSAAR